MPMPTFVNKGTFDSGNGAVTPGLPASIQNDDILLLFLESCNESSRSTPSGWDGEVTNSPQALGTGAVAGSVRLNVFWRRVVGGEGAPTIADIGDHQTGIIIAVRGCKTTGNPWNITGGSTQAATTSFSAPGVTTNAANCFIVHATATDKDAADTAILTAGPTNANLSSLTVQHQQSVATGQGGGLIIITGGKAAAGSTGATTATADASEELAHLTIALEGAVAALTLTADAGSYSTSGTAASLEVGHLLAAGAGSYSVAGTAASLEYGREVAAGSGAYAVAGTDASIEYGREVAAGSGTYAVAGTDVTLTIGGGATVLPADAGSYAITGTAASLELGYEVAADAGSYAVSGTAASLEYGREVAGEAGSYAVVGTDASLEHGREVVADGGVYAVAGTDATLTIATDKRITADSGVYAVAGQSATLKIARLLAAEPGIYAYTGTAATLSRGRPLAADGGAYSLSGAAAAFIYAREVAAASGAYAISGADAGLTVTPAGGPPAVPRSSWGGTLRSTPRTRMTDSPSERSGSSSPARRFNP